MAKSPDVLIRLGNGSFLTSNTCAIFCPVSMRDSIQVEVIYSKVPSHSSHLLLVTCTSSRHPIYIEQMECDIDMSGKLCLPFKPCPHRHRDGDNSKQTVSFFKQSLVSPREDNNKYMWTTEVPNAEWIPQSRYALPPMMTQNVMLFGKHLYSTSIVDEFKTIYIPMNDSK